MASSLVKLVLTSRQIPDPCCQGKKKQFGKRSLLAEEGSVAQRFLLAEERIVVNVVKAYGLKDMVKERGGKQSGACDELMVKWW